MTRTKLISLSHFTGEIKEGEMVFTFEPGIPLGIDLVEVRISEQNGGNRVAIKGIKPEGQVREDVLQES
jgi:hypothetical protein